MLEGSLQVHMLSAEPIEATISFYLEEINIHENNYTLQAKQEITQEQMQKAAIEYLTNSSVNMNPPKADLVPVIGNEVILYTSKINGNAWVEHSEQKKMLTVDGITNITKRVIMLQ